MDCGVGERQTLLPIQFPLLPSTPSSCSTPSIDSQQSTVNSQQSTVNSQQSTVNSQQSTVNSQQSTVNSQQSTVNSQQSTVNSQQSTVNSQQSTVNSQQSTVNSQQSTVNSQQSTVNSQQSTVNSQQSTPSLMTQLHMHHQPILHHPLSPSNPSFNLISPNGGSNHLLDYPPKSPDEQPPATKLLSSPSSTYLHQPSIQLKPIPPLHLSHPPTKINPPSPLNKLLNHPTNNSSNHDLNLLSTFSEECKKMFYTGDPVATKKVESIVKNLPAASKATYTKQMATIRSQFHRDAESSRRAEVDKLLLDTQPSSIIIQAVGNDSSLAAMRSPRARQERLDRLKKFINAHCVRNMVGVHLLHLMSLPARKLGSGKRRVEWDIDLALFSEAGGEPFLVDSIQVLKGVLGFEDHLKPLVASSFRASYATNAGLEEDEDDDGALDMVIGHQDGDDGLTLEERQELEVDESESTKIDSGEGPFADSSSVLVADEAYGQASSLKGKAALKSRDRSLSDPFIDPTPTINLAHSSPKITVSPPATDDQTIVSYSSHTTPTSTTPTKYFSTSDHASNHRRSPTQNSLDAPPPTEIRIFRSPSYLTTPELRELIDAFPSFISVRTKSLKFNREGELDSTSSLIEKKNSKRNGPASSNLRSIHHTANNGATFVGHGVIRISVFEKDSGWKGSFFERIRMLFFRLFNL